MKFFIRLLISPGIPFGNRKYLLICTESGGNIIIVMIWAMSKSYVPEKKIPGQMESIPGRLDKVQNPCTIQGIPGRLAGMIV